MPTSSQDFLHFGGMKDLRRLELFHDGILPGHGREEVPSVQPSELVALRSAFSGLERLTWLNLPVSTWTEGVMPLLQHLPVLKELYFQVGGVQGGIFCVRGLFVLGPLLYNGRTHHCRS
jgi:hypothetical protein